MGRRRRTSWWFVSLLWRCSRCWTRPAPLSTRRLVSPRQPASDVSGPTPDRATQIDQLRRAAARLPIAAGLAAILALRPRRKGTPHRKAAVIQTQIILAIVGAVVMLVVGASLARAFGIVGAAGLVRYRAKIDDPKDAGVMLSTLAVGLAAGVGLWMLAVFSTVFVLLVLGIIESFEPKTTRAFALEIKAKDPEAFKPKVEEVLKRAKMGARAAGTDGGRARLRRAGAARPEDRSDCQNRFSSWIRRT